MLVKEEVVTDYEWTRVEVQLRDDLSENPFDGLYLVRIGDWGNLHWKDRAALEYLTNHPERIDLCNKKLNWDPFTVICFPSDEEIANIDHIPAGGTALCRSCALKEYGLKDCDAGKVDRLWVCFDMTEIISLSTC
ncbi:MAG: hypothetical protein PHF61_08800 [Bacteroidales bacterium]|nr:hypothetical protein [Desulfitobacteriaceae bacterium]MDD4431482.1 hypothetical protein [Bacteroidales bacterium]